MTSLLQTRKGIYYSVWCNIIFFQQDLYLFSLKLYIEKIIVLWRWMGPHMVHILATLPPPQKMLYP